MAQDQPISLVDLGRRLAVLVVPSYSGLGCDDRSCSRANTHVGTDAILTPLQQTLGRAEHGEEVLPFAEPCIALFQVELNGPSGLECRVSVL